MPDPFPPLAEDILDAIDHDFGDPLATISEALVTILTVARTYDGAATSDDVALRAGAARVLGAVVLALNHTSGLVRAVADDITGDQLKAALDYGLSLRFDGDNWRLSRPAQGRRYDNDRIVSRLAAVLADDAVQHLVDPDTGEMPPVATISEHIVGAMVAATGAGTPSFTAWRKKPLNELGIDVNNYEIEGGVRGPYKLTPQR